MSRNVSAEIWRNEHSLDILYCSNTSNDANSAQVIIGMTTIATFSDMYDDATIIPSLSRQLSLLVDEDVSLLSPADNGVYFSAPAPDVNGYDHIILCMSGGKDSIASLLHLIDIGTDMSRVELWHHDVDGREGSCLMDWAFMADYNRKLAAAFALPLYFSWLEGGFEGEMLKENAYSRPHHIETPDGVLVLQRDIAHAPPATGSGTLKASARFCWQLVLAGQASTSRTTITTQSMTFC